MVVEDVCHTVLVKKKDVCHIKFVLTLRKEERREEKKKIQHHICAKVEKRKDQRREIKGNKL